MTMNIYLYGPPGSGKSTLGRSLAQALDIPFVDLDEVIEQGAGKPIPQIFAEAGEAQFRQHELAALQSAARQPMRVIALGGGALLNHLARTIAEQSGQILCLQANFECLLARVQAKDGERPLLAGDPAARLHALLHVRGEHYHDFPLQMDTSIGDLPGLTALAQQRLGAFRVRGMGSAYDVRIEAGRIDRVGEHLRTRGMNGPVVVVCDRHLAELYQDRVIDSLERGGFAASAIVMEPGEENKTLETVQMVWDGFIRAGVERSSTVIALGGGVVGDLTGFAAATFLRGVNWVNLPTSLLAMVDSSLGGKTGIDLPQAKNLVGAFYPPRLVLADPLVLESLPERELRGGLAEVVKHGVIGDPELFDLCALGLEAVRQNLDRIVRQGMGVKLRVIEADPYEKGLRQALNLGHTIGHGVEITSDFNISHGEAVAIGTAAEARLAEQMGLAQPGLEAQISTVLRGLGLPVDIPPLLSKERIVQAMQLDKKKAAGQIRFALPVRVGEVQTGIVVDNWQEKIFATVNEQEGKR
jgi:shikimate kinase / 3-dehydroquinate synthase